MGAKIYGIGKSKITVFGVNALHGTSFLPIGDRIEAGTYLLATAICGGKIVIKNSNIINSMPLLNKISNNTCNLDIKNDIIKFERKGEVLPFDFYTGPFPEFPTDLQPQTVAYLSTSCGVSKAFEFVFENRFTYVEELIKMGADIKKTENGLIIQGVKELFPSVLYSKDLRGGAALVLAALSAKGKSQVFGLDFIDRGYYNLEGKLSSLGADIKRIK